MTTATPVSNVPNLNLSATAATTTTPAAALGDIKPDAALAGNAGRRNPVATDASRGASPSQDGVLMAGLPALRQPVTPAVRVNNWNKAITPYVPTGTRSTPMPSTLNPVIKAPVIGTGALGPNATPATRVFSPGGQMVKVQGVPQLTSPPSDSSITVLNSSLTAARLQQFSALTQPQKMLARSMMAAAIQGLESGELSAKDFNEIVGRILTTSAKANFSLPAATNGGTQKPGQIPGKIEPTPKLSDRPGDVQSGDQVPGLAPRPGSAPTAQKAVPALTPRPGGTGNTTSAITATAPFPLAGVPTPTWWAQATNDPTDPAMGTKMVALVTSSAEFSRQASSINVDKAVNPAVESQTPREIWKSWAAH